MTSILLILLQVFLGVNSTFELQLKKYLEEKFSSYDKYEYEIKSIPENFYRIEIDNEREFRLDKKYAFVPVKIYDRKNYASNSFITLKVKLYKKVLFAIQDIIRNERLYDYMVEQKLVDVTNLRGNPVLNYKFIENKRTKTNIKKGTILLEEQIEQIPDINFNEKVILHVGRNGVDISTEVIAKEEGKIGDIIRVVTRDNKIFRAKVIDKYNVSLIE